MRYSSVTFGIRDLELDVDPISSASLTCWYSNWTANLGKICMHSYEIGFALTFTHHMGNVFDRLVGGQQFRSDQVQNISNDIRLLARP